MNEANERVSSSVSKLSYSQEKETLKRLTHLTVVLSSHPLPPSNLPPSSSIPNLLNRRSDPDPSFPRRNRVVEGGLRRRRHEAEMGVGSRRRRHQNARKCGSGMVVGGGGGGGRRRFVEVDRSGSRRVGLLSEEEGGGRFERRRSRDGVVKDGSGNGEGGVGESGRVAVEEVGRRLEGRRGRVLERRGSDVEELMLLRRLRERRRLRVLIGVVGMVRGVELVGLGVMVVRGC